MVGVIAVTFSLIFTVFTGGKYAWWNQPKASYSTEVSSPEKETPDAHKVPQKQDLATGCLVKEGNSAEKLLETQEKASLDAKGAAEFAGAWLRWGMTIPLEDKESILDETTVTPEEAAKSLTDKGIRVSSLKGAFYRSNFSNDEAYVDLLIPWWPNKELKQVHSAKTSIHLIQEKGSWKVESLKLPTMPTKDFTIGMSKFSGGC
ncbi:hypothetical protein GZ176_11790 [Dermatophilus congolensis]|uniref:hypothetical protein n=1 Tax=Dermatophilus congolensis TaxID=1863 RepID=UPI001AB007D5|nr:hypothetical protein [Dermatophilus congolensis]MBO3146364.1 hypothetical protein [Dermatophilus congolensis]MBO3148593.1 hypothetical protein [Dermatophilus congolensis]MBO3157601.1 hypothetical protein [Dermatophilus congolensis]MBO3159881.1 hypothetical protein [Dermatophilus congolensis]MBO3166620.1 hypothetical protein [Dermatophilus congolensis]